MPRIRLVALVAALSCSLFLLYAGTALARTTVKPIKVAATAQQDGSYAATASCPAGRKILSGGYVSPQVPTVMVNRAEGNAWTIKALATDDISVVAYCSLYVKDVQTATATGAMDGPNFQGVQGGATAECPSGTEVIAGGWEYANPSGDSPIYTNKPGSSTSWTVYGASQAAGNSVTAYAYCVPKRKISIRPGAKTDLPPAIRPERGAAGQSAAGQVRGGFIVPSATATCKVGETLFGGGFDTTPQPDFFNASGPDTFFNKSARIDKRGWKAVATNYSAFDGGQIQAFSLCHKPGA